MYRFTILANLLGTLAIGAPAQASSVTPQLGLGFTNNANYDAQQANQDLYWWTQLRAKSVKFYRPLLLRLKIQDYLVESQNDFLLWSLDISDDTAKSKSSQWKKRFSLGGKHFINRAPGLTEEQFDHFFHEGSLQRWVKLNSKLSMFIEPNYQIRNYPKLDQRWDLLGAGRNTLEYELGRDNLISGYVELGMLVSNRSLYSKYILELGLEWERLLTGNLSFLVQANLRSSWFPSRAIDQETAVTRRRKVIVATQNKSIERHNQFSLSTSIITSAQDWDFMAALSVTSQKSRSGYEDYSEANISASISRSF